MGIVRIAAARRGTIAAMVPGVLVYLWATQVSASEIEFDLGFHNPQDDTELSWLAQPGATGYQLLRSTLKDFSTICVTFETGELHQADAEEPAHEGGFHYLVRVLSPQPGNWGTRSDGSTRAVSCMAPAGTLVRAEGCKEWGDSADATATPMIQDCIEYQYLGGGHLLLTHVNTAFNCCPEFEAGVAVDGDSIVVSEDEIRGDCDCLCLFDLHYEIVNLDPGIYHVTVVQEHLEPGDEPLEFTMDLPSTPTGMHCVERNHYPWNLW